MRCIIKRGGMLYVEENENYLYDGAYDGEGRYIG